MAAAAVAKQVFAEHGIGADLLPAASGELLPLDEAAGAKHASLIQGQFGDVASGVVGHDEPRVPMP
ncbi:hypothetical protein [Anaeromyxobacter paludicola]|uniref:hypothetical protein n=1 Tax=Anaeromyxobacter paludicola TaxID=2918171 RepID=UPI0020C188E4|nr:hypothetical protein [Anaeromyxobacter paludicola]